MIIVPKYPLIPYQTKRKKNRRVKLKACSDDKINVTKNLTKKKKKLERVENIVGEKGKNVGYQHYLLFPK